MDVWDILLDEGQAYRALEVTGACLPQAGSPPIAVAR